MKRRDAGFGTRAWGFESRDASVLQGVTLGEPWSQPLTHGTQGPAHVRLDGLHRDAQPLGDLSVLELLAATHEKDFLATGREFLDRVRDGRCEFLLSQGGVGGGNDALLLRFDLGFSRFLQPRATNGVQGAVSCRPDEIRIWRGVEFQVGSPTPDLQHDVLYDLLGGCLATQHSLRKANEGRVPGAKEGIERRLVAGLEPSEEFAIIRGLVGSG